VVWRNAADAGSCHPFMVNAVAFDRQSLAARSRDGLTDQPLATRHQRLVKRHDVLKLQLLHLEGIEFSRVSFALADI
jgi:hypothetical protein